MRALGVEKEVELNAKGANLIRENQKGEEKDQKVEKVKKVDEEEKPRKDADVNRRIRNLDI